MLLALDERVTASQWQLALLSPRWSAAAEPGSDIGCNYCPGWSRDICFRRRLRWRGDNRTKASQLAPPAQFARPVRLGRRGAIRRNIENQFHDQTNPTTTTPMTRGMSEAARPKRGRRRHSRRSAPNDRGARGRRRRIVLQIRIAVDRDRLGRFKRLEIRRHIDIEKFSVDEQKSFRVGETGELREIVRLDFGQTRRPDLGHARGFIERESRARVALPEIFCRDLRSSCVNAG